MILSNEQIALIFQLRSEGKSLREIERLSGINRKKVGETLKSKDIGAKVLFSENKCSLSVICKNYQKNCSLNCNFLKIDRIASLRLYSYLNKRRKELAKRLEYYRKKYRSSLYDQDNE